MNSVTGTPRVVEGLDDLPGAEGGRLEERTVDLLRPGGERGAEHDARELVVDEHRAVAGLPVEGDQPVRADRLGLAEVGEVLVDDSARPPRAASE